MSYQEAVAMYVLLAIIVIEGFFLACGGFDMLKEGIKHFGEIILWPLRQLKIKRERKRAEQEWQKYIESHRWELINILMKTAHQEMIGEKYKIKVTLNEMTEDGKAMSKTGLYSEGIRENKEEKRTWQDQIMGRFMRQI